MEHYLIRTITATLLLGLPGCVQDDSGGTTLGLSSGPDTGSGASDGNDGGDEGTTGAETSSEDTGGGDGSEDAGSGTTGGGTTGGGTTGGGTTDGGSDTGEASGSSTGTSGGTTGTGGTTGGGACSPVMEVGPSSLITDASNGVSLVAVAAAGCAVAEVTVQVNIVHTCTDDLVLELESPLGTRLTLATGPGDRCDADMVDTVFDDDGTTLIDDGTTPFTGTFRPQQPLLLYDGEDPNGSWTLDVDDRYGGNDGAISDWTLMLDLVPQ